MMTLVDAGGMSVLPGTALGHSAAEREAKPVLIIDITTSDTSVRAAQWLRAQLATRAADMALGIGGPRESEARGIYALARSFIAGLLGTLPAEGAGQGGDLYKC